MKIIHLGKELNTIHFKGEYEIEKIELIRSEYYSEDKNKAIIQLRKFLNGGSMRNNIYSYYFERVANDTKLHHSKWSINEVLQSDELIQTLLNKTYLNTKVYNRDLLNNFKTSLRLGGKGIASKPSQYPINSVVEILNTYLPNGGNYYDPCAGWGDRLLGSAKVKNVNYFATDVNVKLVPKLKELAQDINTIQPFEYDINLLGAEQKQENYVNLMDLVFTSPPYFDLEDYSNGEQSIDNKNYPQWLVGFLTPMLENAYFYLKTNRYCLININDFNQYPLVKDTIKIAENLGFEYKGYHTLNNFKRTNSNKDVGFNDNSEKILIFYKI